MRGPRENRFRPAIDSMFRSAAVAPCSRVISLVQSGTLDAASAVLASIKPCGGLVLVKDPEDARCPDRPRNVTSTVKVDCCLLVSQPGPVLNRITREQAPETPLAPS
jgi:two-component system, chemotaxis family, protein-glutamate methylesterase/glutaminase